MTDPLTRERVETIRGAAQVTMRSSSGDYEDARLANLNFQKYTRPSEIAALCDAFLALENAREANARMREALRELVEAIDAPRYGDDSIWDDLHGLGDDGGPLARARAALE